MPLIERRKAWDCWATCQSSPGRSGTMLWCAACITAVRWREKFCFTNFHVLCCSHETQTTCWDHPKMTELYQSLGKTSIPDVWCFFFFFSFNLMICLGKDFQRKQTKIKWKREAELLPRLEFSAREIHKAHFSKCSRKKKCISFSTFGMYAGFIK